MVRRQVHKPCCGLLWRSINKFYSEITVFCPAFLHSHWSWGEAELCKSILGSIYAKQPGFRAFVARVWLIQSHLIRAGGGGTSATVADQNGVLWWLGTNTDCAYSVYALANTC